MGKIGKMLRMLTGKVRSKVITIKTEIMPVEKELEIMISKYTGSGRTALLLFDAETREPYFTATVNLPDDPLEKGYVFLKGWSENEGLPEELERVGLVELTGRRIQTGFAKAHEAKLLFDIKGEQE